MGEGSMSDEIAYGMDERVRECVAVGDKIWDTSKHASERAQCYTAAAVLMLCREVALLVKEYDHDA